MKRFIILTLIAGSYISCESEIDVELDEHTPVISIDAFINNLNEEQEIILTFSQSYFDNSAYEPVSDASVVVTDITLGIDYRFEESTSEAGRYVWAPEDDSAVFGTVGSEYSLLIESDGVSYTALSSMNRVPEIDSIRFIEALTPGADDDDFQAELFAQDFDGINDSYWIKTFKNGEFLDAPAEINVAYDAGNSPGAPIDGDFFIVPVKLGINPDDEDESYILGDEVRVEIHSITNETYFYLTELAIQTDNEGGFAQLFAAPPSNIRINITSSDPNIDVLGFFSVSAVSSMNQEFTEDVLRMD